MATISDHFSRDFQTNLTAAVPWEMESVKTGETITLEARVHYDEQAYCRFLSFFAPHSEAPEQLCGAMVNIVPAVIERVAKGATFDAGPEIESVPLHAAPFSHNVYIYVDDPLPDDAIKRLVEYGKKKGLVLRVRPHQYAERYQAADELHAFISHDSQDKAEVARPLAHALVRRLCNVWYDEFSLKIGDSLRENIQSGIKKCKKCILILSPNFISNRGWTKSEFDMIFSREIIEQGHVILPVWHKITKHEVYEYCPSLVDRFAGNTTAGIEPLAKGLYEVLRTTKAKNASTA